MASPATELTHPLEAATELAASSPSPRAGAHAAAQIVAITTQDDFLLELGAVLGGQAAVHPVESVAAALEHMGAARRAHILAIDTRDMTDLRDSVGRAYARAADAVVLLFTHAADEESLRRTFSGSKIFAVLPIPIDAPKTALVFAEALADALAKYASPPALADTLAKHAAPPALTATAAATGKAARRPRENHWAAGLGLAILVLAAAPWFIPRGKEQQAPGAPRPEVNVPAVQTTLVKGRVDELLEKARTAMGERRYTEPADDSALLFYRSAQAADPGNAEAIDGLARVAAVLSTRFDADLQQSHVDAAAVTLANFKSAAPHDPRSAAFESHLATAKAHAEVARREEQARLKSFADVAAQSAREQEAAQRKTREHAAALAVANKAAQEKAELAGARQAEEAAAQADRAAQTAAASHPAAQMQLKLTHYVTPDYPPSALAHNVAGTVIVAYTVDEKGGTREVRVVSAEPAGIFDRDAVAAVKRWRYAPMLVDNAAVAVPTRIAIQFTPK